MSNFKKINVLTTNDSPNSFALNFPLVVNKKSLLDIGVQLDFFYSLKDNLSECDVLFINSKFFKGWYQERKEKVFKTLTKLKEKVEWLLWFDTTDSTGTTQFEVMPYVDGYYKNQILQDKTLYFKEYYGGRIYTDFYHRQFQIEDEQNEQFTPLPKEYAHKLDLSWNSSLIDYGWRLNIAGTLRKYVVLPPKRYTAKFIDPNKQREIDLSARFGTSYSKATIACNRVKTKEVLEKLGVNTQKISRQEYLKELQNAKVSISPFAWGEVCYRDFETVLNGALLFKPDMSHLQTWPPLYEEDVTYVPYKWDFSDFETKLSSLLKDDRKRLETAQKGQDLYEYYLYGKGQVEFCQRIVNMVKGHSV